MNGILPIALLGVAGFFLYRYYSSPEPTQPAGGGSNGGSAGAGSGSTGSTPSGGGSSSTGDPYQPGSGSTGSGGGGSGSGAQLSQAEILKGAAIGLPDLVATADAQNWRLNVDQWNWYREQGGGAPVDPGYMDALIGGDDRAATISASEYRRRLSSQGLGYVIPAEILRWM